ncbi:MAG: hypothetical protein KC462_01905, partial [Cyanobacteria bacterium HKST-UBA05]|nr:hypothetical protein [Cyanobacteria bacterium HKST-UBA05]
VAALVLMVATLLPVPVSAASPATPAVPPVVVELETRYFQKQFAQEPLDARVARLETFIYGLAHTKKPMPERLKDLTAIKAVVPDEAELAAGQPASAPASKTVPPAKPAATKTSPVQTTPQPAPAPVASGMAPGVVPGETSYPTVAEMEQTVFGQSRPTQPLKDRLEALEEKVFNQKQQGSLQERSDRLEMVLLPHKAQPMPPAAPYYQGAQGAQGGGGAPMGPMPGYAASYGTGQPVPQQQLMALSPQVTQLEQTMFRRTYVTEPIEQRVGRLEMNMFQTTAPELPLEDRVQRLSTVAGAQRSQQQELTRHSPYSAQQGGYSYANGSNPNRARRASAGSQLLMILLMVGLSAL